MCVTPWVQELYSGSNDQTIVVWSPIIREQPVEEVLQPAADGDIADEDTWSDGEL